MTLIEPAPFTLPSRYVLDLRALGTDARTDALASTTRLVEEVALRLAPNVHRYELLARQQHVALLAATVAAALEETETGPANPPLRVAEGVCAVYRMTHLDGRRVLDLTNRALDGAIDRVLASVRAVQEEDEQQLDNDAETDRRVVEHERDLAARDDLP